MSGAVDPIYIAARSVLLDALEALADHRSSITLIGAQAIYLHAGDADVAVAPYTADGDLALDPRDLQTQPAIEAAMRAKGFELRVDVHGHPEVGIWAADRAVGNKVITVDLLVPESLGGRGREAELAGHNNRAARNVSGIEGCLVDKSAFTVTALDAEDQRAFEITVAGAAALLVSKCHKLAERAQERGGRRLKPKDAQDVLRLLRKVQTNDLCDGFRRMDAADVSRDIARTGLDHLRSMFGRPGLLGCDLAVQASEGLEDQATIRDSCAALTSDLLAALR